MNSNRVIKVLVTNRAAIIPAHYLVGTPQQSIIPITGYIKRGNYWVNTIDTKHIFTDSKLIDSVSKKAHWGFVRIATSKLAITGYRNSLAYVGA